MVKTSVVSFFIGMKKKDVRLLKAYIQVFNTNIVLKYN